MAEVAGSASSPGRVYLRSRKGCVTCRTKKVKCDEERSICGRCRRLGLQCDWNGRITAKARKKNQESNAVPKKILPRSQEGSQPSKRCQLVEQSSLNEYFDDLGAESATKWSPYDTTNSTAIEGYETFLDDLDLSVDLSNTDAFYAQPMDPVPTSPAIPSDQPLGIDLKSAPSDMWLSELSRPLNIFSPDLPIQGIALAPSFQVTKREHQALHHFQTQFSFSRTSKCPLWSTHAVMLRLGSEKPMIMHLIIASSLTDLSLRSHENVALYRLAEPHFQTGLHLLIDTINSVYEPDQMNILPAFFLIYVYMSMRQDTSTQAVSQLSKTVLDHVQRYNLDGGFSGGYKIRNPIPSNKRAFIFRMLIWLFFEDVASCFLGQGGVLARYFLSDANHLNEIYEQSTTSLESYWGPYYPDSEAVDDVENATVLRLLFDVMSLFQTINQHGESFTFDESEAIEQKLDALEEKSRALFRLTKVKDNYDSRVLLNTDWVVVLFYSLRIYHFRCTLNGLEYQSTPPKVQAALTALLLIAQRRYTSDREDLFKRLQMPLFMAGIETSDAIYREWISSKLSLVRYKNGLELVLQLQSKTGTKATMSVIRQILRGGGESPSAISSRESEFLLGADIEAVAPPNFSIRKMLDVEGGSL